MSETNPNILERILQWLRAGYPAGIPQHDYIALFGILHRSLTPEEVERIADQLHQGTGGLDDDITHDDIRALIEKTVHEEPSEDDVRRVAGRLAEGGWPLVAARDLKQSKPS